ncbi:MAG: DNA-binding protein WhiA [Eubacteriales bacterium]
MSFSSTVKNEICRKVLPEENCPMSELSAILRSTKSISIEDKNISLSINTESSAVARRIYSIIKNKDSTNVSVQIAKNRRLKKHHSYIVKITNLSDNIIGQTDFLKSDSKTYRNINKRIPINLLKNRSCKKAYIRSYFLCNGSITNPEKSYHLEFVSYNQKHAKDLADLLSWFNLKGKYIKRNNYYITYLKESEQIVDLLNIFGAYNSLLDIENIRIIKDMRNNINRVVNCETANLSKTVNTAVRQIRAIRKIDELMGIENLPDNLKVLARLRLKNKESSLKELGDLLDQPIGKSGVNYRLKKIEKIAEDL